MPDPRLRKAAEEIRGILKKYDIGAIIILASQTHGEYVYELEPTWSCTRWEGPILRIRSKRKDYPSLEAQKKHLEETISMIGLFHDSSEHAKAAMEQVLKLLGKSMEIEHSTRFEPPESH